MFRLRYSEFQHKKKQALKKRRNSLLSKSGQFKKNNSISTFLFLFKTVDYNLFSIILEIGLISQSGEKIMAMKNDLHNPIHYIIPPHIVDAIKLRGNKRQQEMALGMEKDAEKSRETREAAGPAKAYKAAPIIGLKAKLKPKIEVYDAGNQFILPGILVRDMEKGPLKDTAAKEAYSGAIDTYNLYYKIYRRNSTDGQGKKIISTIHYGQNYNNAFWNGVQMVFGDGDGTIFESFTNSLSIIGHELSHAIVQFSGGLSYRDQSGALNESFADVFGCLTVQYKNNQISHEANWLIGDGIFGTAIKGEALRSMKAPGTAYDDALIGKDPQPFHMDGYVVTSSDRGGVHINSGIVNHAFYLLSQYLGGFAWEKAGQIWYDAMQEINNPNATFNEWADKTVEMARKRFGLGSKEVIFTRRAWKLVGISV